MTWQIDLEVAFTHPLVDGRAEKIVDTWLGEVADSYANQGVAQMGQLMDGYFRNPTPYYETQVTWDRVGADRVIHDRGIIYGPWLAGTGSRNATSRFKGYAHWRRTVQYLNEIEGPRIVNRHMPRLIGQLGG